MDIKEYKTNEEVNQSRHPWELARLEVIFSNLKPYLNTKGKTIYDIGCGDTFLLNKLSKRTEDINLIGIDIEFSDEMINNFTENNNIRLFKNLDEIGDNSPNADIVLLLDIIEHIENVDDFLNKTLKSNKINKGAIIMITVPAFNFLFVERDKWLGHYRRYTLKTLKEIENKHNLQKIELKYFFTSLFFARFLQKQVEKIKKPKANELTGIGNYKEKKIFDFVFRNFLIFDYNISNIFKKLGIKLPGLSCMAIFTKQE